MIFNQMKNVQYNRSLFQFMRNEVIIVDCEGKVIFCNASACNLLKKQEDKLIGNYLEAIIPSFRKVDPLEENSEAASSYEWKIEDQTFIIHHSKVYEDEEWVGFIILFQNITELKKHEHLLVQRIAQYENALDLLSECIISVDRDGYINFVTKSYVQFLGIGDPISVIGRHCTEVIENTRFHKVIETGKAEIGDIQRINGQNIIATRIPIFKDGEIVGAIGKIMFQDVKQLKSLANQINSLEAKLNYYEQELKRIQGAKYSFESIIGNGSKIEDVKNMSLKVAKSRSTVLISGESGTGKELFAHAIHQASPRSQGPFIRVNCAAIPKDLLEAELFGYEEGAFTGAKKGGKPGKIELANHGTMFLDEIGDMPLEMQAKLLRVIQEKEIERIGGTKISRIDVRFIAATHQNLWKMIHEGKFREDLYYRLNVFTIHIPPLRERKEDILSIATFLLNKLNHEMGTNVTEMDKKVIAIFMEYDWPGNIRELENVLERSMNIIEGNVIQLEHLPVYLSKREKIQRESSDNNDLPQMETESTEERATKTAKSEQEESGGENYLLLMEIESAEKRAILKALNKASGNIQLAARLLGIHRASLYRKMDKYKIKI